MSEQQVFMMKKAPRDPEIALVFRRSDDFFYCVNLTPTTMGQGEELPFDSRPGDEGKDFDSLRWYARETFDTFLPEIPPRYKRIKWMDLPESLRYYVISYNAPLEWQMDLFKGIGLERIEVYVDGDLPEDEPVKPIRVCRTRTPEPHLEGEFPLSCYACHMVVDA
jgi:hypothetical protein